MNRGLIWGLACWEEVTRLSPSDTFKTVAAKRSESVSRQKRKTTTKEKIRWKNVKVITHFSQDSTTLVMMMGLMLYFRHDDDGL